MPTIAPDTHEYRLRPAWREQWRWLWPESGASNAIAALDGLRGVAVLMVIGYHTLIAIRNGNTSPTLNAMLFNTFDLWLFGATGVQLFFVLSGFLLFLPYARAMLNRQPLPDTRKFYVRRALRILPAYWASVLILYLLTPGVDITTLFLHLVMLQNLNSDTIKAINGTYWTMAIESQFYVILPLLGLILVGLAQRGRGRTAGVFVIGLLLSSPFVALLNAGIVGIWPDYAAHSEALDMPKSLNVFAVGMICSIAYVTVTQAKIPDLSPKAGRITAKMIGLVALVPVVAYVWVYLQGGATDGIRDNLTKTIGFIFGAVVLGTLLGWRGWATVLAAPPLRFIGGISYSFICGTTPSH